MVCATLAALYLLINRRASGNATIALGLTILAAHLSSAGFTPRPQLFTYFFLVLSMIVFFNIRDARNPWALLGLLAVIQIIWANMHAAAPIFILICVAHTIGDTFQYIFERRQSGITAKAIIARSLLPMSCGILPLVCMVVNPNGLGIYQIFTDTVGNGTMPSSIGEWRPVDFHIEYGQEIEFFLFFSGVVLAATKTRRNLGDVAAIALLAASALYSVRNVSILALVGAPIIAPYLGSAFTTLRQRLLPVKAAQVGQASSLDYPLVVSCTVVLVFALGLAKQFNADVTPGKPPTFASHAASIFLISSQPEDACKFIEAEKFPLSYRIYNDYNDGAYLIWRLREFPVFISSETYVYFGPAFDTYVQLQSLPYNWRDRLAMFHPDFTLVGSDSRQAKLFLSASDWALVYTDAKLVDDADPPANLIFVKRTPASLGLIARCRRDCPAVKSIAALGYAAAQ
jgi:hypothetical protein